MIEHAAAPASVAGLIGHRGRAMLILATFWLIATASHAAEICAPPGSTAIGYSANVKAFGAVGDGTTDDTAAITRAAACAASLLNTPPVRAAELYFPAGAYAISAPVEIHGRADAPVPGSLTIRGDGMLASRIIASSHAGIFALGFDNITTQVQVSQLGLFTSVPDGGAALSITMPAKGLIQRRGAVLRDITIGGIDIHRDYFATGVSLYAVYRPLIDDVLMTGPYGPGSDGVVATGICFDLQGDYSPTIEDSACWSAGTGLQLSGIGNGRLEGIFVTRSKFVNVDYGIVVSNPDRMPEGMISENHINAHVIGLSLKGKKFMTVTDNLFYHPPQRGSQEYDDILLDNTEKILLRGNTFHFPSDASRVAIRIEHSRDDTISANMFDQPGSGVAIGHGVLNTEILDNRFFVQDLIKRVRLNGIPIVDNGVGTHVVSLPNEAGISHEPAADEH